MYLIFISVWNILLCNYYTIKKLLNRPKYPQWCLTSADGAELTAKTGLGVYQYKNIMGRLMDHNNLFKKCNNSNKKKLFNLKIVIFDLWTLKTWNGLQGNKIIGTSEGKGRSSHFISSYFLGIYPVTTDVKQISNIKYLCYMNSTIIVITNKHRKRRDINNRLLFKAHYFTLTLQFIICDAGEQQTDLY